MKARQELCHRIRVFQNKNKNTYVCQKYICMSEIHMYVRNTYVCQKYICMSE